MTHESSTTLLLSHVSLVSTDLDSVHFSVTPVHCALLKIQRYIVGLADIRINQDLPLSSIHEGAFDAWLISQVAPVYVTGSRVHSQTSRIV